MEAKDREEVALSLARSQALSQVRVMGENIRRGRERYSERERERDRIVEREIRNESERMRV